MTINDLHRATESGEKGPEERLFQALTVRFRVFVLRKVGDQGAAEEIVQEALMTIARLYRQEKFDTSFSAWAYNVLKNRLKDHFRRSRRESDRMEFRAETPQPPADWTPDPTLESRLVECLRQISRRSPIYARALNLKHLGYEASEICDRLKVTANHFYVSLSRARSLLKHCLEKGKV